MKIYSLPILLLFTTSAHAVNTYNANTNTLSLDTLVILQTATKYTGAVSTVKNMNVFSEDLTPPTANEFATYDNYRNIVTIPSVTYQDGSQHYHVQAVIDSYTTVNAGTNAGTVVLPCYYFNIDNVQSLSSISIGMTYTQISKIMGCPVTAFYYDSDGKVLMEWTSPDANYELQVKLSSNNIATGTAISANLLDNSPSYLVDNSLPQ